MAATDQVEPEPFEELAPSERADEPGEEAFRNDLDDPVLVPPTPESPEQPKTQEADKRGDEAVKDDLDDPVLVPPTPESPEQPKTQS